MADDKNSSTIDFSKYSGSDLIAALGRIDRDKFPTNYESCKLEIEKRKTEGRWSIADATNPKKRTLFSLFRRFAAHFLDGIFIGVFSLLFTPASGLLNSFGPWGILPFLILNFAYATLYDGPFGEGQTIGKRITRLKVVGPNGSPLSWLQASVRGGLFMAFSAIHFGYGFFPESAFANYFNSLTVAFLAFNILFMIKHSQNRSLVDLISNTLVHDTDHATPEFKDVSDAVNFKGWIAGVAVLVLIYLGRGFFLNPWPTDNNANTSRAEIDSSTNLRYVDLSPYQSKQRASVVTNNTFWLSPEYLSDLDAVRAESKKAREILIKNRPPSSENSEVNVVIVGNVFKGLLPMNRVYRNFDLDNRPLDE